MRFTTIFFLAITTYVSFAQRDTTLFFDSGEKRAEGQIKDGREYGVWTYYYESGAVKSKLPHKGGYANGICISWYESGQKESEIEYRDGQVYGQYVYYYENGNKRSEGRMQDGKEGIWLHWNEKGELVARVSYKNGLQHGLTEVLDQGKIIRTEQWEQNQLHGQLIYFTSKGKKERIRYYEEGVLISEEIKIKGPKYKPDELKLITDIDISDSSDIAPAVIRGEYVELNVSYRPEVKSYVGRAYVWINDTTSVMIESGDLGIRPKNEIDRCKGRRVEIIGILSPNCHAWGDGTQQTIVMPCISNVREVLLYEE